jgi:hypothetical protein
MRKLISVGLFAFMISMYTGQVFASHADVCDQLKGQGKGLFGLCVAWHNADEKDKGKIEDKFNDRADFTLASIVDPGCPCWAISPEEAGSDGSPFVCVIDNTENFDYIDLASFADFSTGFFRGFNVDTGTCYYSEFNNGNRSLDSVDLYDLTIDEETACRVQIREIAEKFFGQDNGPKCTVYTNEIP